MRPPIKPSLKRIYEAKANITKAELRIVKSDAKKAGLSVSSYVRAKLLGGSAPAV